MTQRCSRGSVRERPSSRAPRGGASALSHGLLAVSASLLWLVTGGAWAAEGGDDLLDLEDLKGKDREKAIERLCASKDVAAASALIQVLAEPKEGDSEELRKQVFQALLRLRSKDISEELRTVMASSNPVIQGYGFRIFARTYGAEAADELLALLPNVIGSSVRQDLIVALRDCPSPKVVAALRELVQKGGADLTTYTTLLRLGDATFADQTLQAYASACEEIQSLTAGLKYASDFKKAERDRVHIKQLLELKAELRDELALLPKEAIPGFAAAAARATHPEVHSLLARLLPKLLNKDTALLYAPLISSPSMEVKTLVIEAIAGLGTPEAAAILKPRLEELAKSTFAEMRKVAVRYSDLLDKDQRLALARSLLKDADKWVRIESIEKLADWQVADARGQIEAILDATDDPDIRWSAEYAVKKLGAKQ